MSIAVWDTYVKSKSGAVLHFDIVVPDTVRDEKKIFEYGKMYLASMNEHEAELNTAHCQFCHIEEPSAEILQTIGQQGFYIIEMETIPVTLPQNPSRRDKILHLRAHSPKWRFADFREVANDELDILIGKMN